MDIKKPDSSPASNIWERNYRDCVAKLQINMEINKKFFENPKPNGMELVDDVTPDTYLTPVIPYDIKYRMGDELYDNE